jgi:hypothetical protein
MSDAPYTAVHTCFVCQESTRRVEWLLDPVLCNPCIDTARDAYLDRRSDSYWRVILSLRDEAIDQING